MKKFDESIHKLTFYFNFNDMLFLNYRLQSLKNEFCITNILCHLLFYQRSPNSDEGQDFVSSIRYHFSLIFSNNKIFSNEIELLFVKARRMRFNLEVLYSSGTYFQLVILNRIVACTFGSKPAI